MPYRIVDWDKNFENNRTRSMKEMQWVPITNRMDGAGYTELVEGPKGAARLGCWIAIVEIASTCEVRGTLLRKSRTLLPTDLARISRLSIEAIEDAIAKLLEIQWLEEITQEGAGKLRESGTQVRESGTLLQSHKNGTEGTEGTERNGTEAAAAASAQRANGSGAAAKQSKPSAEVCESPCADADAIAWTLASDLAKAHAAFQPGRVHDARTLIERLLATSVHPQIEADKIRESHRLYCLHWAKERAAKPGKFVPQLPRWIQDGDYLNPPPDPEAPKPAAKPKAASNVVVKLPGHGQALTREQVEAIRAGASVE